jgi:hypothetical protein
MLLLKRKALHEIHMSSLAYNSFLFSFLLYQASAVVILAQDGPEASSVNRLSAKYGLLIHRQNIEYCGGIIKYSQFCPCNC